MTRSASAPGRRQREAAATSSSSSPTNTNNNTNTNTTTNNNNNNNSMRSSRKIVAPITPRPPPSDYDSGDDEASPRWGPNNNNNNNMPMMTTTTTSSSSSTVAPTAARGRSSWHIGDGSKMMMDVSTDVSMDTTTTSMDAMASAMSALPVTSDDDDDSGGGGGDNYGGRRLERRPVASRPIEDPPPDRDDSNNDYDDDDNYDTEVEEVRVLRRPAGGGRGGDHVVPMLVKTEKKKKKKKKHKEKENEKQEKKQQKKKKQMDPPPSSSYYSRSYVAGGGGGGGDFYSSCPDIGNGNGRVFGRSGPPTPTGATKKTAVVASSSSLVEVDGVVGFRTIDIVGTTKAAAGATAVAKIAATVATTTATPTAAAKTTKTTTTTTTTTARAATATTATSGARGRHNASGRADPPPAGEPSWEDSDLNRGSIDLPSDVNLTDVESRESRLEEWFRRRGSLPSSLTSTVATFDVGSVVGRGSHQFRGRARRRWNSPAAAAADDVDKNDDDGGVGGGGAFVAYSKITSPVSASAPSPSPAPTLSRVESEKVRRKARSLLVEEDVNGDDDDGDIRSGKTSPKAIRRPTPPEIRRKAAALLRRADESSSLSRSIGSQYAVPPSSPGWEDRNSGIVAKDLDDLLCAADGMLQGGGDNHGRSRRPREDSNVVTEDLDDLLHTADDLLHSADDLLYGSRAKLFDNDDNDDSGGEDDDGISRNGSSINTIDGSDCDVDIDRIDDSLRSGGDNPSSVRTAKHINRQGSNPTTTVADGGGSTKSSSSRQQRSNNRLSRSKKAKSTSGIPNEMTPSRSMAGSSRKKAASSSLSSSSSSSAVLTEKSSATKMQRGVRNNGGVGRASPNKKNGERGGAIPRSNSRSSITTRHTTDSAHSFSMRKESKKGRTAHDDGERKKRWNDENSLSVSFRSGTSGVSGHSNANISRKGKKKPKKKEGGGVIGVGPSSKEVVGKADGGESWGRGGGASSSDTPVAASTKRNDLASRDGKKRSKKAIITSRAVTSSSSSNAPLTRSIDANRSDRISTSRLLGVSPDDFPAPKRREGGDDRSDDERRRGNLVTAVSGAGTSSSGAMDRRSGDGGGSSSENNNEQRAKSRLGAILPRRKKQGRDRVTIDDDEAARSGNGGSGGGYCPSRTNRLRRYLFSYASRKRRHNDDKDQEEKKNIESREEEKGAKKSERKNPYALTDDAGGENEAANDGIAGNPIRVVHFSPAHLSAHDIPVPPSLIMTPSAKPGRMADLASFTFSSNSSGGGPSLPGQMSSLERAPSDLTTSLLTNSSSHHLLKISEHDVLSDRDIIKGHSTHSDSALGARGKKGDGWNKGGDGMRLSAHSEGTNTTGMLTLTSHSHSRSPSSGRPVVLNLEDRSRLLSLPFTLHPEGSSSEIDTSGSDEREAAKHSILRTLEMGTSDAPNVGLTKDALAMNDNTTHVINLPWSDDRGDDAGNDLPYQSQNTKLRGKYTGPVNDSSLRPHGEGALVIQAGYQCLTFYGRWDNGTLVSPLNAEPPGKESCNISTISVEGRRGSLFDDSPPHNSPNVPKHTRSKLARASGNSPPPGAGTTSNKSLNIKYIINRSGKAQHLAHTNRGRNFGHQFRSLRYTLGEACRTPIDMVIHRSNKRAIQSAALLKKWDEVFIKRSNGLWTVAIMIDRALQPKSKPERRRHEDQERWRTVWEIDAKAMELEESMLFAIDDDGATKIIDKKSWGKYIRRMKG